MSKKDQAERLKTQGNQAVLNGQYDRAIELYTRAIELEPSSAVYHNNISLAYFRKEDFQGAEQHARKSIELDPKYLKAHIKLVETLIEVENFREATVALKNGLELNDTSEELLALQERLKHEESNPVVFKEVPGQRELLGWLANSTAKFNRLGVAQFGEEYRGVVAKKKIHKKDQILFVPRSHMITLELAKKECPTCSKLLAVKCYLLSPKHTYLSLYLLQERSKPDSFWKEYIKVLPYQYGSFPIFYQEHELNYLQGSGFLFMIKERVTDLRKDYEAIRNHDLSFTVPFMEFCWARTTVCSRIFGLVIDGIKTDAMVPFADMLNHRVPKHTSWNYSQPLYGFVIESVQDIYKGEEVFDSYGKKCNSRFLLNYGFVMENNDANEVSYKAHFRYNDSLLEQKKELIADKSAVRFFKAAKSWSESGFQEFLGFLRFVLAKDLQPILSIREKNKITDNSYRPTLTPPISLELYLEVWREVLSLTLSSIKYYPTSLQQDLELLQQNLPFNMRNCVVLRAGEKYIFSYYKKLAEEMIGLLYLPHQDILAARATLSLNAQRFVEYHIRRLLPKP